jgi:hypothetical protein
MTTGLALAFVLGLTGCRAHHPPPPTAAPSRVTFRLPLAVSSDDTFCVQQPTSYVPWTCVSVGELRELLGRQLLKADP